MNQIQVKDGPLIWVVQVENGVRYSVASVDGVERTRFTDESHHGVWLTLKQAEKERMVKRIGCNG